MIPIRDDNPTHGTPVLTVALIVVNVLVFLFQATMSEEDGEKFVWKYGYIPAKLVVGPERFREELQEHQPTTPVIDRFGRVRVDPFGRPLRVQHEAPLEAATATPVWISLFTCMFLHGGWAHLLGNMLYLWIFGNNIEDRLGRVLFLIFYLGTGLVGNFAHTYFEASWVPLVGASGAISGVMGGYVLVHPHAHILAIIPLGWYWFTAKLPAWVFLGVYIVLQNLFPATLGGREEGGVAYWAHIGGFAAGAGLIFLLPRRPVPAYARPARPIHDDDADIVI